MKNIYLIAFILCGIFGCKTNENVKPNQAPSAVTITSNLAGNGKDVILNWTKSVDPDGDAVTYTVFYKDTLVKNFKDTTYTLKDLPYESSISGKVLAIDSKGLAVSSIFTNQTASAYVKIPDIEFEKALIGLKIDNIQDGLLLRANAEKVTELDLGDFLKNFEKNPIHTGEISSPISPKTKIF